MFGSRGQRACQTQQAFVLAAGTTMPSVASLGRTSSLPGIHMAGDPLSSSQPLQAPREEAAEADGWEPWDPWCPRIPHVYAWLVVWNMAVMTFYILFIYWECHHPN